MNEKLRLKFQKNFIEKAQKKHVDDNGNPLYYYDNVYYNGANERVTIICPIHGEFKQTPNNHLRGNKCPYCQNTVKRTTEEFIKKAQEVHKNEDGTPKYDYSITNYINKRTDIEYICPKHGVIKQNPSRHLHGNGCRFCAFERITKLHKKSQEQFIKEAIEACKDKKYSFEKTIYIDRVSPVTVTCHELDENGEEHGDFEISARSLLQGYGCHKCGEIKQKTFNRKPLEQFIKEANDKFNSKYDYSDVVYINKDTEIEVICHNKDSNGNEHGKFKVKPVHHLHGSGCPKCNESRLEREIRIMLEKNNIEYEFECNYQRFKWLSKMSLDFYLPQYNIAIECQGIQHFKYNSFFDSDETVMKRDEIKRKLCEENGVKLLYFSNLGIDYPYEVFEDKNLLLEEIKKEKDK